MWVIIEISHAYDVYIFIIIIYIYICIISYHVIF